MRVEERRLSDVVRSYFAAWNATDPDERADALAEAFTSGGVYTDPVAHAEGLDGISEMIAGFQGAFPDHTLSATTGLDEHHDCVRFGWKMTAPHGATVFEGIDVGLLDEDGRLRRVVGFIGEPAPADAQS